MDMIFPTPWAVNGELEEIPDLEQSNGSVSFEIGFGSDYQKDIASDINAKNIERKKLNYLFNLMCNKMNALGEMVSAQGGGGTPIGVPFPYPLETPPEKHMKCNGSSFDVDIHTELALLYPDGILPDLRGLVIRGWDDGRGFDIDRLLLSFQDTAAPNIVGSVNSTHYAVISSSSTGALKSGLSRVNTAADKFNATGMSGFNFDASRVWSGYVNDLSEIRVRNMAFNYIMRVSK